MTTKRTFFVSMLAVALAGCASYQPAKPEGYVGPLSTIQDTATTQSPRLVHMFYVSAVDDRKLQSSGIATSAANQGRGFAISPVTQEHQVPARPTKLTLVGSTMYAAPILAMTNPTCHIEGTVDATLEAGKSYRVNGALTRDGCAVWLEAAGSGALVGQRVSGAGTK